MTTADREVQVEAESAADGHWTITVDGREYRVDATTVGRPDVLSVIVEGRQTTASVRNLGKGVYVVDGAEVQVIDPRSRDFAAAAAQAEDGVFEASAYMPGRVTALLVREGEDVASGQGVLVLEAMKMENEIPSDIDGRVEKLLVEVGQTVDGGDPLFVVVPTGDDTTG